MKRGRGSEDFFGSSFIFYYVFVCLFFISWGYVFFCLFDKYVLSFYCVRSFGLGIEDVLVSRRKNLL